MSTSILFQNLLKKIQGVRHGKMEHIQKLQRCFFPVKSLSKTASKATSKETCKPKRFSEAIFSAPSSTPSSSSTLSTAFAFSTAARKLHTQAFHLTTNKNFPTRTYSSKTKPPPEVVIDVIPYVEMKGLFTIFIKHHFSKVICYDPNDQGRRPGLMLTFLFLSYLAIFGLWNYYFLVYSTLVESDEDSSRAAIELVNAITNYPTEYRLVTERIESIFDNFTTSLTSVVKKPWSIILSAFSHSDLGHLLGNSFALFLFAPKVYAFLGPKRFVGLYIAGALGCGIFDQVNAMMGRRVLPRQTFSEMVARSIFGSHYPTYVAAEQARVLYDLHIERQNAGLPTPTQQTAQQLHNIFQTLSPDLPVEMGGNLTVTSPPLLPTIPTISTTDPFQSVDAILSSTLGIADYFKHNPSPARQHLDDKTISNSISTLFAIRKEYAGIITEINKKPAMNCTPIENESVIIYNLPLDNISNSYLQNSQRKTITRTTTRIPSSSSSTQNQTRNAITSNWRPSSIFPPSEAELEKIEREVDHETRTKYTQIPSLGASGSLMAIIGMYTMLFPRDMVFMRFALIPIPFATLMYIMSDVAGIIRSKDVYVSDDEELMVANAGHLGGMCAGVLYAMMIWRSPTFRKRTLNIQEHQSVNLPFVDWFNAFILRNSSRRY